MEETAERRKRLKQPSGSGRHKSCQAFASNRIGRSEEHPSFGKDVAEPLPTQRDGNEVVLHMPSTLPVSQFSKETDLSIGSWQVKLEGWGRLAVFSRTVQGGCGVSVGAVWSVGEIE